MRVIWKVLIDSAILNSRVAHRNDVALVVVSCILETSELPTEFRFYKIQWAIFLHLVFDGHEKSKIPGIVRHATLPNTVC
jgi:hypothetical protein